MSLKVESRLFGEIEYNSDEVYEFENGIPGFPEEKSFLLISLEDSPFTVMHSAKRDVSFFLIDPFSRFSDYEFSIPDSAIEQLKIEDRNDVFCYAIAVLREPLSDSTVNLAAPILLNQKERKGMQLAFENPSHPIRTPLFVQPKEEEVNPTEASEQR